MPGPMAEEMKAGSDCWLMGKPRNLEKRFVGRRLEKEDEAESVEVLVVLQLFPVGGWLLN